MTKRASSPSSNEFWEVICHHDYLTNYSNFEQNTGPNNDILPRSDQPRAILEREFL
jgi:hypothetical protein